MPITSSAKKALRASKKKRIFNIRLKSNIEEPLKKIKKLITAKKHDEAKAMLPSLYQAFDKGAKKGYIKKNAASRYKSRISAMINKIA